MSSPHFFDGSSTQKSNNYCCGSMSAKTGVKVIIVLMAMNLLLSVIAINSFGTPDNYGIANIAIQTLVIGCLIASLVTNKSEYLLPVLILQVLSLYFCIGFIIYIFVQHIDLKEKNLLVGAIILVALNILRNLWFFSVTYEFYKDLKEEEKLVLPK